MVYISSHFLASHLFPTPCSSCGFGHRTLRFLTFYLGRRSLGHSFPRPCGRCSLTLGIIARVARVVLLLGRGVCSSSRAGQRLRLLRQRPFLRGSLGWNGGIIFFLDRLDTLPSDGFFESWNRIGLIFIRDGGVPSSPPGCRSGGTRFFYNRDAALALFRRCGCSPPAGHSGRRWI